MNKSLNLKNDITIAVKLIDPITKSTGVLADLKLMYGKMPELRYYDHVSSVYLRDIKDIEVTSVKGTPGITYSLIDIEDGELVNLCKYVYTGKARINNIRKISFSIPELAPYFLRELDYGLDNDVNITGNLLIEPLEAIVNYDNNNCKIRLHQGYTLKSFDDHSGFGFTNRIFITFESDNILSLKTIESLTYKISNLFTWITGFPVTVNEVDVFDADNSGSLYIPTIKKDKEYNTSFPYSFMHHYNLRKYFNVIVNNYFDTSYDVFDLIWSRTIPLFELSNVLEYEVMLFASVLDKYCSFKVNKLSLDNTLPKSQYEILIDNLENKINEDVEISALLSEGYLDNHRAISGLDKILPNTSLDTFIKKIRAYLRHIGNDCTEVFINNQELHEIKCIRDRAAHGEIESLSTDRIIQLLWKLKTLIMYLIYLDLGIDNKGFLEIFRSTHHPIRLNCDYDQFKLDVKIGIATVIRLNSQNFNKVQEFKSFIIVVYKAGDLWTFDEELSTLVSNYFKDPNRSSSRDGGYNSYKDFIQDQINNTVPKLKAVFATNPYLVNKNKKIKLHSVVVIEKSNN